MKNLLNILRDKYYFPQSSFMEYIKIGFNFNHLEIKMKGRKTIYIYEILDKSDISQIRSIYFNQDFESIGKFYNNLKREGKINLIEKRD